MKTVNKYISETGVEFDNTVDCKLHDQIDKVNLEIQELNQKRRRLISECEHRELLNKTRNKMVRSIIRGDGETVGEEYYKTHGFCRVCKSQVTRDEDTGAVNVW